MEARVKPVRSTDLTNAAPVDCRSHGRTPSVQLRISERDALIRAAARFYPGCTGREIARRLHAALLTYRNGRFRRDRDCEVCPVQHRGKRLQTMWMILKVRDHVPSEPAIRRALGVVLIQRT
jgi:hypothetical protein